MAFGFSTAVHMASGLSWPMSSTEFGFVTFVNESVSPGRCVGVTCCTYMYIFHWTVFLENTDYWNHGPREKKMNSLEAVLGNLKSSLEAVLGTWLLRSHVTLIDNLKPLPLC